MLFCHELFHAMLSSFPSYLPNDLVLLFILLCVDLSYHHMFIHFRFDDNDLLWSMHFHGLIIAEIQMFVFQQ